MLEALIQEYLKPIVLIIGQIEFTKRIIKNGLNRYQVMQICFCLVAVILITFRGDLSDPLVMVFEIVYETLFMISITTLFYDLFVKKIKAAGGKIKG